jgi:hypothetical protein
MSVIVDTQGRPIWSEPPPGDDPWHVQIGSIRAWSSTAAIVNGAIEHGTGGVSYKCGVKRNARSRHGWVASCNSSSSHVH